MYKVFLSVQVVFAKMGLQLENHGINQVLDLFDALPKVWGYSHSLEQVVLNLLSNAWDACEGWY